MNKFWKRTGTNLYITSKIGGQNFQPAITALLYFGNYSLKALLTSNLKLINPMIMKNWNIFRGNTHEMWVNILKNTNWDGLNHLKRSFGTILVKKKCKKGAPKVPATAPYLKALLKSYDDLSFLFVCSIF